MKQKRFLELNFSSIPSEFFLLSSFIYAFYHTAENLSRKLSRSLSYSRGNAKMGKKVKFLLSSTREIIRKLSIFS